MYLKIREEFVSFHERCLVVHIPFVRIVKFQFFSGSPCPLSCVLTYSFSVLICCIHLSCVWSFRLYYHITYICCFVASYLFLLCYDLSLSSRFVLLLEEIQFLLKFPFLCPIHVFSGETSLVSHLKYPLSSFSSHFVFWLFPFFWSSCCQYCFWWLLSVFLRTFLRNLRIIISMS